MHDKIAPTFWILSRAGGVTAYVLLTCGVLLGLCVRTRVLARVRPAVVVDLHRTVSLLALGATGIHLAGLAMDVNHPSPPLAYVVPGLMAHRTPWTAAGVVAAELMLVIHLSFRLRSRIGARVWRRLHWATYAVFAAATAHGLGAGSDAGVPWARGMYLAALAAVVALTARRALAPPRAPAARPRTVPLAGTPDRGAS
ncbi:MAG: ferric reductase-like transmembrane domain-containing protein [Thermoleophilia bacterium]